MGLFLESRHDAHDPAGGDTPSVTKNDIQGGYKEWDAVYPYVQNVHLRDTGKAPGEFQVRIGQGEIDYSRVVNQLERHGYDRSLTVSILDRPDNAFDVEVEVRKLKLLLESLL